jgi:hypothetical protein
MNKGRKSPRERAAEARKALEDPASRSQFADDPERLGTAVADVLRRMNPTSSRVAADEGSSCGGWYAAEDLCLQMAIGSTSDASFASWSEMADACHTAGEGCEALEHVL